MEANGLLFHCASRGRHGMCSGSTAAPQQDGCSEFREWQVLKTGEGAEPKPNVAGIFLPGIAGKTAAEVIFFPFHLFLQRLTAEGEAAAAFNSLLPPQEVFGSAPFTLPPRPPPSSPASCTCRGQDHGSESSAVSRWCSTPQWPHTVRCQQLVRGRCLLLSPFFFFLVCG